MACPSESLTLDPANLAYPNWPPTTGTNIARRPTPCSVLVGIQPRHLPQGSIWSRGNLLSCSTLSHHLATLVWRLGAGRATLCHLVRWLGVGLGIPCHLVQWLSVNRATLCYFVSRFKKWKQRWLFYNAREASLINRKSNPLRHNSG